MTAAKVVEASTVAEQHLRALRVERVQNVGIRQSSSRVSMAARQLQQWKQSGIRFVTGSLVYSELGVSQRENWYIAAFLAAISVEAFLIAMLFIEVRRRKASEQALKELSGRLINASEEERKHLARELHDDMGQRLSLLAVNLDILRNSPASEDSSVREKLDDPLEELKELTTDVHNLSHWLHSSKLQHLGLPAELKEVCRQMGRQHHLEIELKASEVLSSLPEDVSLCFYRVAQEALNNAVKHSHSKRIELHLDNGHGRVRLQVKDFGVGFDPRARVDGLGLATMQERLRMLGGTLSIRSMAGSGTELIAEAKTQSARVVAAN